MNGTVDNLDPRWNGTQWHADTLWTWNESNGVFSYVLERDPETKKYWLTIERCDAGRRRVYGAFVNHTTATNRVVKHIEGGK